MDSHSIESGDTAFPNPLARGATAFLHARWELADSTGRLPQTTGAAADNNRPGAVGHQCLLQGR